MFELGTKYDLSICETSGDVYGETIHYLWTAVEIDMPVVKFMCNGEEWILNISSPLFLGAKPSKR
jgi:hypothetical protein